VAGQKCIDCPDNFRLTRGFIRIVILASEYHDTSIRAFEALVQTVKGITVACYLSQSPSNGLAFLGVFCSVVLPEEVLTMRTPKNISRSTTLRISEDTPLACRSSGEVLLRSA
jgi:hypothetical protein